MTLTTAVITLLLVMDPLGNIPFFLAVLNSVNPQKRRWVTLRETIIAFLVLILFLFFGKYILRGMNISDVAVNFSGGIILFLISIKMIFPTDSHDQRIKQIGEPFIVPLAVPLIAGPSTIAMVMLLSEQAPELIWQWTLALFIAWFLSTVILLFADTLRAILGERGLIATERLMGMILTTMAVQMFLTGIERFLHFFPN